jgi:SNF2 family DNA or RNA helicase
MSYKSPLPSYNHQIIAAERVLVRPTYPSNANIFAYLCEQGVGKTKMALDEFGVMEDAQELCNLLIVAPKGAYANWCDTEIPKHVAPELLERTIVMQWKSGAGVTHKRELERALRTQDRPRILAINVEALSSVQAAVDLCDEFIHQRKTLMIIDESTRIKGIASQSARARNVIELGQRAYARRIMTGTVAPRSPLDLFSQFEFLDWRILGFQSYYAFRSRYAILKKMQFELMRGPGGKVLTDAEGNALRREIKVVTGYRYVEELQERIAPYSYRVLKEDCLDLPPKVYMPLRTVELTTEQRRILKDLKLTAQTQLRSGDYVTSKMKMSTLLRMHQVLCGHVKDENGKEHAIPSNRIRSMLEVLDEQVGKAIIWSGFTYCIKEIVEVLKKEYGSQAVVHYYGATSDALRVEAKVRFQNDPSCRWFVANQEVAGMALTLTKANLSLYYSNTWDLEDRLHSEDRPHRAGLDHKVTYVDLVGEDSPMEFKLINNLRKKLDIQTIIQGDSYREWLV